MKFLEDNLVEWLQRPELAELRNAFLVQSKQKNGFICHPETEESAVFIVSKGRARVFLGYEDKEFNLAILAPGDLYSTHTGAYVQAMEPMEILLMDTPSFMRHMMQNLEVTSVMIKVLGNVLKSSFNIIDGLVFKDASCRLLSLLLHEAKRQQPQPDGTVVLHINLSVEQIARMVGSSRQTISTQLNRLIRQDLIQKQGRGSFVIPDLAALERYYASADCI
ncbi:Crp/Fnr family transcriptional regulator [Desulfobulbus rhabdoformis]|uniref:Crp/Fnr family transcriptional regulator n=1 Tax=Desulfobulbus rhabdoformis TaxID=34032 RepID=UPI001964507B|nr:Crp/Fnr family transcriptional regulator [Desulfobulbus rhabdoformis]MBM9614072.1 Crp/Fnr family transcriptional regulator [Desulfobulbus rhabdoformis]